MVPDTVTDAVWVRVVVRVRVGLCVVVNVPIWLGLRDDVPVPESVVLSEDVCD